MNLQNLQATIKLRTIFCALLTFISCVHGLAQEPEIRNFYTSDKGLPQLQIERSFIYVPEKEWMYSHHPYIVRFKNQFIAVWSNGMIDEDAPGQRIVFSVSSDFFHWSKPGVLAAPPKDDSGTLKVLTAAGLHQYNDTLVAYYGEYAVKRTDTKLWARWSKDGVHWSEPINTNMPVNANHGPHTTATGRLIICGNFTFPYTDDPKGLSGWKMSSFYPDSLYKEDNPATFYAPAEKLGLPPLCEGSFYQTDDGTIHTLLRVTGKGWKGRLWLTESRDNGTSWSMPVETKFSDNDSKFHFGRLPDKRFYYVGIPDTLNHYGRNPLVISLSSDGKQFNKDYIIANSLYQLKKEGLWKGGQYGYPHTMLYKDHMYIIISRQKEAVEILRFKLNQLQ